MSTSYPDVPGSVAGSPTSARSADEIAPYQRTLQDKVLSCIRNSAIGLTCEEVELALGGRHQGISARIRELVLKGRVIDSGVIRRNKFSRKSAVVWYAGSGSVTPPAQKEPSWMRHARAAKWTPPA